MMNVQGLGRDQVIVTSVPDGDAGTAQTLGYARQLIQEGLTQPEVRNLAIKYIERLRIASGNRVGQAYAIFEGVRRDFKFLDDPAGTELLQPVLGIMEKRLGDCDDLNVILLCSLLGSIGFSTRAVTIKADPDRPDEASHVYMQAQLPNGQWVALDVARANPRFNREPERFWDKKVWPMTEGNQFLNGLGAVTPWNGMPGAPRYRLVKKSKFPGRGLGQDPTEIDPSMGISESDYESDQSIYTPPAAPSVNALNPNLALTSALASAPSILTGVAQVVKASNTPGQPISGVVTSASGVGTTAGPSGGSLLLLLLLVGGLALASSK